MPETIRPIYHAHLPLTLCVLYNTYSVVCVLCYRKVDKAEKNNELSKCNPHIFINITSLEQIIYLFFFKQDL